MLFFIRFAHGLCTISDCIFSKSVSSDVGRTNTMADNIPNCYIYINTFHRLLRWSFLRRVGNFPLSLEQNLIYIYTRIIIIFGAGVFFFCSFFCPRQKPGNGGGGAAGKKQNAYYTSGCRDARITAVSGCGGWRKGFHARAFHIFPDEKFDKSSRPRNGS